VNDDNAAAARRWIAERLLWERFLEQATQGPAEVEDLAARPAA
jgi:hypothetical protein